MGGKLAFSRAGIAERNLGFPECNKWHQRSGNAALSIEALHITGLTCMERLFVLSMRLQLGEDCSILVISCPMVLTRQIQSQTVLIAFVFA
jgi:hypothetical protein